LFNKQELNRIQSYDFDIYIYDMCRKANIVDVLILIQVSNAVIIIKKLTIILLSLQVENTN